MAEMTSVKVGDVIGVHDRRRHRSGDAVYPMTVSRVGRKYFYAVREPDISFAHEYQFHRDSGAVVTNYSPTLYAYPNTDAALKGIYLDGRRRFLSRLTSSAPQLSKLSEDEIEKAIEIFKKAYPDDSKFDE
ncbi:hypothetical protein NG831_06355 [Xanthomonas sacchari]|uniref:beta barrel domain-containing protein n=1 Tax=Xanthomonas sacchari TaxID=56458 RepID=UPI002258DE41|nr:hypothetical protein [Xanthomonas sacchari]UYK67781.1 hypothetical protein NG831_06355 [Xanthomonas sacchari]